MFFLYTSMKATAPQNSIRMRIQLDLGQNQLHCCEDQLCNVCPFCNCYCNELSIFQKKCSHVKVPHFVLLGFRSCKVGDPTPVCGFCRLSGRITSAKLGVPVKIMHCSPTRKSRSTRESVA